MKKLSISSTVVLMMILIYVLLLVALLWMQESKRSSMYKKRMFLLDSERIKSAIEQYRETYGNFPSGETAEILRKLMGDNPQRERFLPVNERWQSLDRAIKDPWGVPYIISYSNDHPVVLRSIRKDHDGI